MDINCIVRETKEESTLNTKPDDCVYVGNITGARGDVDIFGMIHINNMSEAKDGDVHIEWCQTNKLPSNVITNLRWLIPFTKDFIKDKSLRPIRIKYNS